MISSNHANSINTKSPKQNQQDEFFEFKKIIDKIKQCDISSGKENFEQFISYLEDSVKLINKLSDSKEWNNDNITVYRDEYVQALINKSKFIAFDFDNKKQAIDLLQEVSDVPFSEKTVTNLKQMIESIKNSNNETIDNLRAKFGAYFRFIFILIFGYVTTSWIFPDYLLNSNIMSITLGEILRAIFAVFIGFLFALWLFSFPNNKENYRDIWSNLGFIIFGLFLFGYLMSVW